MSALLLRIIACAVMLIDHIGLTWGINELRIIGRLAFPIFAFLLVNGYRHTKNLNKYILRLGIFALLSEIPFDLFLSHKAFNFNKQNIFFTLFLGLVMISLIDILKEKSVFLAPIPVAVFCLSAMIINCDYGYLGILTVLAFHIFYASDAKNRTLLLFAIAFLSSWPAISYNIAEFIIVKTGFDLRDIGVISPLFYNNPMYIQIYRVFALVPIFLYNGEKGKVPKSKTAAKIMQFGFYAFYPVHMLIIYLISQIG